MAYEITAFDQAPWEGGGHPLESEKTDASGSLAVLRFEPGFSDPHWCQRSHVLYGIEGVLTLDFEHQQRTLNPGQACRIESGTRHRAANRGTVPVVLFAVSDLEIRAERA